jgi:hypothetical protein
MPLAWFDDAGDGLREPGGNRGFGLGGGKQSLERAGIGDDP